jgi:TPR repeat protein
MKRWLGMLALVLIGAGWCMAHATDAEAEKRRQEMAAKREAAEARERAEAQRELEPQRYGLQLPVYRYPSPSMFQEAAKLERSGKEHQAVTLYERAARAGSSAAAWRLAEIHDKGIPGIARDHAVSVQWEHIARVLDGRGQEGVVESLFRQAQTLEHQGRGAEAVKLYEHAARSGSGKAALRLSEIYDKGIPGVARDYAESLKWHNAARVLGEDVPRKP